MNLEEIRSKFKLVSDEVESNASQQEKDIRLKVASVTDETAKKFGGIVGSK
jgi:hypothetical protein